MQIEAKHLTIDVKRCDVFTVRGIEHRRIVCNTGELWITQQDDPHDIVLTPGESVVLDRSSVAYVQALRTGQLTMFEISKRKWTHLSQHFPAIFHSFLQHNVVLVWRQLMIPLTYLRGAMGQPRHA